MLPVGAVLSWSRALSYSAAINACRRAPNRSTELEPLHERQQQGVQPNVAR